MEIRPLPDSPQLLLSFDFDGTLHLPRHEPAVVPELFQALDLLREELDAIWAVNTGRSLSHTLEGLLEGGFPSMPDFLITREREIFKPNRFGRCEAFGDWNKRGLKIHDKLFRRAKPLLARIRDYVESETQAQFVIADGDPAGLIATSSEEMLEICEHIAPWVAECEELSYERNSIYLRFSHRDFNKGSSLKEVASQLGLTSRECFAIGDGPNDLSMLSAEVAAFLACPANSSDEALQQVTDEGGYMAEGEASVGSLEALVHHFDGRVGGALKVLLQGKKASVAEAPVIRLEVEN